MEVRTRSVSELPAEVRDAIADCLGALRWGAPREASTYHERLSYLAVAHGIVLPSAGVAECNGIYRCARCIRQALGGGHISAHVAAHCAVGVAVGWRPRSRPLLLRVVRNAIISNVSSFSARGF